MSSLTQFVAARPVAAYSALLYALILGFALAHGIGPLWASALVAGAATCCTLLACSIARPLFFCAPLFFMAGIVQAIMVR